MEKLDYIRGSISHRTEQEGYLDSFDPGLKRAFEFAHQKVDPAIMDHQKAVKMHKDKIKLSGDGTFYTIQGEGPTLGYPCVFLRLHVCNLKCTWCDAWYTWNPNTPEFWTESRDMDFDDCANLIKETWKGPENIQKRLIITGGEPLIQKRQLDILVNRYLHRVYDTNHERHWWVEVETNGTLMPTDDQMENWQFNVSPKLANSENRQGSMVKPKILQALTTVNSTFKFVCMTEDDLDEIEKVYLPHIDHHKIIIMPQGITEEEISMNAKNLIEPCKKRGLRMTPRFQAIFAHGAARGV